jgi:hypothetical protein
MALRGGCPAGDADSMKLVCRGDTASDETRAFALHMKQDLLSALVDECGIPQINDTPERWSGAARVFPCRLNLCDIGLCQFAFQDQNPLCKVFDNRNPEHWFFPTSTCLGGCDALAAGLSCTRHANNNRIYG